MVVAVEQISPGVGASLLKALRLLEPSSTDEEHLEEIGERERESTHWYFNFLLRIEGECRTRGFAALTKRLSNHACDFDGHVSEFDPEPTEDEEDVQDYLTADLSSPTPSLEKRLRRFLKQDFPNGAGNILDISGIAATNAVGKAAPAPARALKSAFGSMTPTIAAARKKGLLLSECCRRSEAVFFAAHKAQTPHAWCFVGVTPD